ncbi:MAG: hypothetical protein K6C36_03150 [Clostridia bacterium]|nr:hypothetical protein [Clostridia bacterium]
MKCPKCGGEIPFYDIRPNCRHCGVNIMYYSQDAVLARDAKRTELEGAAARMVIARIKAEFIGSKIAIARMIFVVLAAAALLIPFAATTYSVPFYSDKFSIGIIGIIQAFNSGLFTHLPTFLSSSLFSSQTLAAVVPACFAVIIVLIDAAIVVALLLGFLNLSKGAKFIEWAALIGAIVSVLAQIAAFAMKAVAHNTDIASYSFGFGAVASCAMFVIIFFLNRKMVKDGIEPVYRENDIKRRAILKQVRAGEVDLDDLTLPVFESEEEHDERLKQLAEALKAEEEGKEL